MHIFLTGAKRSGKSTVVRRVTESLDLIPAGFVTRWDGERLLLCPADGSAEYCAARRTDGGRQVFARVFSVQGCELIKASYGAALCVMDELGFMESASAEFCAEVLRRLDDPSPVLGVLRQMDTDFLSAVAGHKNVRLITLTEENRGELPGLILSSLE